MAADYAPEHVLALIGSSSVLDGIYFPLKEAAPGGLRNVSAARIISSQWPMAFALGFAVLQPSVHAQGTKQPSPEVQARILTDADKAALTRALAAYDQGRAQESESVLRDLVRRFPSNFEATETLGLIYAEGGDLSSALPLLEKACILRPSSALAQGNLGAAYLKLNRVQDALRVLRRSATLDPKSPETQSALGQALLLAGRPRDAATAFAAAASEGLRSPDLLYNWGLALFNAGDAKHAVEVLARFPEKESSAQVQSLLGDVEEKQGHYAPALVHFQTAAKLDPSEPNVHALGLELIRHWTFPAAIKIYEYGVSKYPESARMQLGLGIALYGNDDYAASAPVFSRLVEKDPENILYADLLGRSCLLLAEKENSGCDTLEEVAGQHPQNTTAAMRVAEDILRRPKEQQDLDRARHLLEQAIAADPKSAGAYFQMGVLEQQQEHWQESATMLEKAVAFRPEYAQAHYRLARAYAHIGKREQAEQQIALQQKYSQLDEENLSARTKEATTFLVTLH